MPLPERTIEAAIERLKTSPGTFQRLVERYAYLTYPNKFNGLIPQGRSSSDVTVKGWPDIYSFSPAFMLNVVEVTHSPAWARHLEEDLEKAEALGSDRLSGFLFVAWATEPSPLNAHKEPNPQYEQLLSYRTRLVALGIPPEDINFVFKKQLVRALSQPRFANIVTDILGLPSHCAPFKTISNNKEIYGASGNYDVFAPSKEEFENELVHRAAITDEVEKRLNSIGWAWLRGRGAAGKTVLSIHVGRSYEARSLPAYYLDLSKTDASVSEALNVITTHADDGVLFILDNVHLNQGVTRDCFDHWESVATGSHLLMIGRDTTTTDFRGTALPLDDLRPEAQTLEVTLEDLKGVFLRLARRRSSSDSVPTPPDDVLKHWHKLFGGDLIAFSAAVAHRSKQMGRYDWTIQARDATTYVRLAYLGKASDAERLNLLRLAVSAQLELDVPEEALELATIEPFLQNGLVHSIGRGRNNRYAYYRLVHTGLGDLLLTAAGYSDEELQRFISEQYGYIACKNPFAGSYLVARLESRGRAQEASLILKGITELENGLEQMLVANGVQSFRTNAERLTRLGVLSESEIADKLAAINPTLDKFLLKGSFQFLHSFLDYIELNVPRLYSSLIVELEQPENAKSSIDRVLQTPLGDLPALLQYAERKLPKFYKLVVAMLEQPESARELAQLILRTPLHFLPSFLEYTEGKLPNLYNSLVVVLEQPESAKLLGESALRTSLNDLPGFLQYAEGKLPKMYNSLLALLEQPESVAASTELVLKTPLHLLSALLDYAERKLPKLHRSLVSELAQPENARILSERALHTPLANLPVFLEYAEGKLFRAYNSFVTDLEQPENARTLSEKALQMPLLNLPPFLDYLERKLHKLHRSLVAELEQPNNARSLSGRALQTPLGNLPVFLQYAEAKLPKVYDSFMAELEQPENVMILSERTLQTPLLNLPAILEYLERKLPKVYRSLVTVLELPEKAKLFCESALQTPLYYLPSCLDYADQNLPRLYRSLVTLLEQPENLRRLSANALQTPLGDLPICLAYAEQKLPNLYNSLVMVLNQPENAEELAQMMLRTPLHYLPSFLEYAERKLPELFTSLMTALEQPENAGRFAQLTLQTPLNDLAFFLQFADEKLPRLHASLVKMLQQPESIEKLSKSALDTPLGDLASFLKYVDEKLPAISEAVTNRLIDPTNINFIAETVCRTHLDNLVHFLQTIKFGPAILEAIDKTKWDRIRQQYISEQLYSFPAAVKTFQSLGRPDLGEAPAIALIRVADQHQWKLHTIGLHHLSHVMRLGRSAGEDSIRNFITNIVTPSWLKEKYDNSPTYGIANALFSLWGYYNDALLSHFNTKTLRSRVRYQLNYLSRLKPEELSAALQLLGVCALLGARVGTVDIIWPDLDRVNEALQFTTPSSEATSISYVTIQVWLGLRVMAGIRPDPVYIQPELGEPVLAIWKSSTGYTDKQNALNRSMIPWVESCAKSGWMLVADRQKDTRT